MVSSSLPASRPKFAKRIADAGFDGVWVSIANPCDVVTTELQYLTGADQIRSSAPVPRWTPPDSAMLFPALPAIQHLASTLGCSARAGNGMLLAGRVSVAASPSAEVAAQTGRPLTSQSEQAGHGRLRHPAANSAPSTRLQTELSGHQGYCPDTKLITPVSTCSMTCMAFHKPAFTSAVIGANGVEKMLCGSPTPRLRHGASPAGMSGQH